MFTTPKFDKIVRSIDKMATKLEQCAEGNWAKADMCECKAQAIVEQGRIHADEANRAKTVAVKVRNLISAE